MAASEDSSATSNAPNPPTTGARTLLVVEADADIRLDRWFKRMFPELAHGRLEKLLRTGQIRVDGKRVEAGARLTPGQAIRVPPMAAVRPSTPKPIDERAAAMLTRAILHRDRDVLVLDKPPGLAVQGGTGTVLHVDGLLDALRFEAEERPRLVHRLDRDTSGVLVLARNARAAAALAREFKRREAEKIYWAVVAGVPDPRAGTIDLPLSKQGGPDGERMAADKAAGQRAVTRYEIVETAYKRAAWLALEPETGRTHQLRVHCAALGTPILGDGKYGGAAAFLAGDELSDRLHLHARRIRIAHPAGGVLDVTAPLPPHMRDTWRFLGFNPTDA